MSADPITAARQLAEQAARDLAAGDLDAATAALAEARALVRAARAIRSAGRRAAEQAAREAAAFDRQGL